MEREKQELHCHNCDCYVQFEIDTQQNGNHEIRCPNCGHIHYRLVVNGIITESRWNPNNNVLIGNVYTGTLYTATIISYGTTSVYGNYVINSPSSSDCTVFTYGSWGNNGTQGFI
jgi:DNA-directed RNA polymerase subunit RPC12/RpoP